MYRLIAFVLGSLLFSGCHWRTENLAHAEATTATVESKSTAIANNSAPTTPLLVQLAEARADRSVDALVLAEPRVGLQLVEPVMENLRGPVALHAKPRAAHGSVKKKVAPRPGAASAHTCPP